MLRGVSPSAFVIIALLTAASISILMQYLCPEAIPIFFIAAVCFAHVLRVDLRQGLPEFLSSSAYKDLALFSLFTFASLHIHTAEVLWGLSKAAAFSAHSAGYKLGHAIHGLA